MRSVWWTIKSECPHQQNFSRNTITPHNIIHANVRRLPRLWQVKSFLSHVAHWSAVISITVALSQTPFTLQKHRPGANASRAVSVYFPAVRPVADYPSVTIQHKNFEYLTPFWPLLRWGCLIKRHCDNKCPLPLPFTFYPLSYMY